MKIEQKTIIRMSEEEFLSKLGLTGIGDFAYITYDLLTDKKDSLKFVKEIRIVFVVSNKKGDK